LETGDFLKLLLVDSITGMYTDGKGNYYERQPGIKIEKVNNNVFKVKQIYFKKTKALVKVWIKMAYKKIQSGPQKSDTTGTNFINTIGGVMAIT